MCVPTQTERTEVRVDNWLGNDFSKTAIQTYSLPTLFVHLRDESNEATTQ